MKLDPVKFERKDITFDGRHFVFAAGVWVKLKEIFSDVDIDTEVRKLERWLLWNPPKKNYTRFVCNNLNRARMRQSITAKDEAMPKIRVKQKLDSRAQDLVATLSKQMRS